MNLNINGPAASVDQICTIDELYDNSTIFISGGTGFLGKLLVEKLLRSFPVKKIYLLIRTKNKLSAEERLQNLFKESVFDRIRQSTPEVFEKVRAIYVDFDRSDLCISEEYKTILLNEVEIVFNIVASVKFNEKFRDAIAINVGGTKKILNLVLGMKNLKAFLHISTLYSNCNRKFIEEKVYEQSIGYESVLELTRDFDETNLRKIESFLSIEMPNTYTMTKRCSENLVNHIAYCLPAGIFRPPIVLSTYKEPVPGWTDNLYGPSGLCVGTVRGFIHAIYGNPKKKANLVPADYCVNAMIASAWDSNRRYLSRMQYHIEMPVYNYIFDKNNLTWGKYMQLVKLGLHEPLENALWYYSYHIIPSKTVFDLANMALHKIPGFFMDVIAVIRGKERIYSKCYEKVSKVIMMMSYFGLREWTIYNSNIVHLSKILNKNENKKLEFNLETINWNEYFMFYIPGIKTYFFKENYTNLERCKKRYGRLLKIHLAVKTVWWILLSSFSFLVSWRYLFKYFRCNLKSFLKFML